MSLNGFTRLAIVGAVTGVISTSSLAALDYELAMAPFSIGPNGVDISQTDLRLAAEFASKEVYHGIPIHDDAIARAIVGGRIFGLGARLKLDMAISSAPSPSRALPSKTSPGEFVAADLRIDYALRFTYGNNIPLIEILPVFNHIEYPNQRTRDNPLKSRQNWVGGEAWWMTPLEGLEIGGDVIRNLDNVLRWTKGTIAAREFIQHDPYDWSIWQGVTFANASYRKFWTGRETPGIATGDLGGQLTIPVSVIDCFLYMRAEGSYWLDSDVRKSLRGAGIDGGQLTLTFGFEYRPE